MILEILRRICIYCTKKEEKLKLKTGEGERIRNLRLQ